MNTEILTLIDSNQQAATDRQIVRKLLTHGVALVDWYNQYLKETHSCQKLGAVPNDGSGLLVEGLDPLLDRLLGVVEILAVL